MKQIAIGVILGVVILAFLLALPGARPEQTTFLSPPIPPVPPICKPGETGHCLPWRDDLRDWREGGGNSPLAQPARHCGKRYGEDWCD